VTGIRVIQSVDCRCRLYRNFYGRWYDPANVSNNYTHVEMQDLESKHLNFKNFIYFPDNPDAPCSFK